MAGRRSDLARPRVGAERPRRYVGQLQPHHGASGHPLRLAARGWSGQADLRTGERIATSVFAPYGTQQIGQAIKAAHHPLAPAQFAEKPCNLMPETLSTSYRP